MPWKFAREEIPEKSTEWTTINVCEDADGSDLHVPVCIVNGGEGPTIWYQACAHGDEHTGSIALRDFITGISPSEVDGRIIAVPIANRSAFNAKSRTSPIDNLDLNRQFPGDETGTYSEQVAKVLQSTATDHADYFVDLHSGRTETYIAGYSLYVKTGDQTEQESRELCNWAGLPYSVGLDATTIDGLLLSELAREGIPSIITETGGEGRLHQSHVDDASRAIRTIARQLGVLGESQTTKTDVSFHDGLDFIKAPTGGYFERRVAANEHVSEGSLLAEITDIRGSVKQEMIAPYDGIVVSLRTFGVARPGDQLFELTPE